MKFCGESYNPVGGGGGEYGSKFRSDEGKIQNQKNVKGFQQNPKKSLDQKLTPWKISCLISEP